jgi:hypothetical protein
MKKICFLLLFLLFALSGYSQSVNGNLTIQDDKIIIKVWGTHYERGYAQGYLLADNIKTVWENYIYHGVFYGSSYLYNNAVSTISTQFEIENKYHEEATGLIEGMRDSLNTIYIDFLNRELNKNDIFLCNALVDYLSLTGRSIKGFGCSSLSGWQQATSQSDLEGNLLITRFLDWQSDSSLKENPILMVQFPSEENEIPWVSIGFPGLFGALSSFNINGVSAFMNMGNINNQDNLENLHPIWLSVRNAIESIDYNSDGYNNKYDVFDAVSDKNHSGPFIVQATDTTSAIVIEVNNLMGAEYRTEDDNTQIPQNLLVATNHFRKLYSPVYCDRYEAISDSLNNNSNISVERSWDIMGSAAGSILNLQAMQYSYFLGLFYWSTATSQNPAYLNQRSVFNINELFSYDVSTYNNSIKKQNLTMKLYPNPVKSTIYFSFENRNNNPYQITIYNLKGEKIYTTTYLNKKNYNIDLNYIDKKYHNLKSGFYIVKATTKDNSIVSKFIYIK